MLVRLMLQAHGRSVHVMHNLMCLGDIVRGKYSEATHRRFKHFTKALACHI